MLAKAWVVLWATATTWVADNLENMGFSDQMGIESAKWRADIEMVDPLDAISASSKRTEAKRCKKNMSILVATKTFRFFRGSSLNTARRCAWPSQVTWRRRLPGPPHQRCCLDLIWIWRGINGEHWFRFQKFSFELSRSHGHYSYKMLQVLKRVGLNWILNH